MFDPDLAIAVEQCAKPVTVVFTGVVWLTFSEGGFGLAAGLWRAI
ncbi:hypothetical protein TERTU_2698 [Teredinibacter turnerae T7901]|uniref:Uncharacterized protein n=1 Tax=Teredinibacter turnerae (strain ATCC 39867 / T7901) TaxID=377629 RepID=C5BM15_TERTT|nr:hypothetical protein TERTU_2698 [Teredinibacter turnerae T7901]